MFAFGIRYLNGFVAASEPDHRERPEWPPHPGRVFLALAAAYFQGEQAPLERSALEWLERLPPPRIAARRASPRGAVDQYVPVNDQAVSTKLAPPLQSAPAVRRDRQPRKFARAWLEHDTVHLIWDATPDAPLRQTLEALASRVTRIGHSTSLVQMWVADPAELPAASWVPEEARSEIQLRIIGPGTLEQLERRYNARETEEWAELEVLAAEARDEKARRQARKKLKERFCGKPPARLRPDLGWYQGYARPVVTEPQVAVGSGAFSPYLLVFLLERRAGPYRELDLGCTLVIGQRWREALVAHSDDLRPELRRLLTGHEPDGTPLAEPHLAMFPLAFVGHPQADGHLLGMAVALPRNLGPDERRDTLRVLAQIRELRLGRLGVWGLERDLGARPATNLRPETWTALGEGARQWSTVTPVAFDRHPKSRDRREYDQQCADMIVTACEAVGLPRPAQVIVTSVSAHLGVPPAFAFPRLRRKDGSERRHTHAILVFEEPVTGPVLLGAGRYRGYGLCRPLAGEGC